MLEFKTQPKDKQREALQRVAGKSAFAFLMDMGTGKTWTMINDAAILYTQGKVEAVLVLTLNGGQQNWAERELPKHSPVPFEAYVHHGDMRVAEKRRFEKGMNRWDVGDSLQFFLGNIEMLGSERGREKIRAILDNYKTYFAIDESHRVKAPNGTWAKAAIKLGKFAKYRRIATGTSNPHSPLDLWSQFQFLDPFIFGCEIFTKFRARFAQTEKILTREGSIKVDQNNFNLIPGRDFFLQINGFKNIDKLKDLIAPYSFSCRLTDVTDMPPLTFGTHEVPITPMQRRMTKELINAQATVTHEGMPSGLSAQDRIMWLVNHADVLPDNALTKTLRLQQVSTGFVKNDDDEIVELDTNHPDHLINLIEAMGKQQIIIWCTFLPEIATVTERLEKEGINFVTYIGETSAEDRTKAIDDFQAGEAQVFLGNAQTAGLMITLTAATQIIWYSMGTRAGDYIQANRRAWRLGQDKPVHVTHMLTSGTLGKKMLASINERAERMETIQYD